MININVSMNEANKILDKTRRDSLRHKNKLMSYKCHKETYMALNRIKKANKLRSVGAVIDMLIATAALAQLNGIIEKPDSPLEELAGANGELFSVEKYV